MKEPRYIYVVPSHHQDGGGWLWVLFIILLFVILVVVWSIPYRHHHHETVKDVVRGDKTCFPGEMWDSTLELCAPLTPTPVPVVLDLLDNHVPPCSSFYHHMCGEWMRTHDNADLAFTYAIRKNERLVHDIVTNPESGPIYAFYRSCVQRELHSREDKMQRSHVLQDVVGAFRGMGDLPVVLGRLNHYGFTAPFTMSVEKHPTHPTLVPLFRADTFSSATVGSDLADFWIKSGERVPSAQRLQDLCAMIEEMEGWRTPNAEPNSYAEYISSGALELDTLTFGELLDMSGDLFWIQFLRELDGHALDTMMDARERVWMIDRHYFTSLFREAAFTVQQWRDYATLSVLEGTLNFTPVLPDDAYFRLHDVSPVGPHFQLEHRLKRGVGEPDCVALTHKLLPGVVAHEFLHQMGGMESVRAKVTEMTLNLRDTYADMIRETEWMDPTTKARAISKIEAIIVRAVHPNHWRPEPFAHRITPDRWLRNLNLVRRYRSERNYGLWKSRDPLDRDTVQRFGEPLSTVNAYYSPVTNTITVFAGILSTPFYDEHFSLGSAYARIGSVLGHELSHAMDNSGRLFDEQGDFDDWWSPESAAAFNEHAACISAEFGAPHGCHNPTYGEQTLGEAIADKTGVDMAYRAYFGKHDVEEGERTLFFQAFAQQWCSNYSLEIRCKQVGSDPHPLAELRVDKTLAQMPEFADAFSCPARCGMVNPRGVCTLYG